MPLSTTSASTVAHELRRPRRRRAPCRSRRSRRACVVERLAVAARGEAHQLEAVRIRGDHLERLHADRAGRTEDDDAPHDPRLTVPSGRPAATRGRAIRRSRPRRPGRRRRRSACRACRCRRPSCRPRSVAIDRCDHDEHLRADRLPDDRLREPRDEAVHRARVRALAPGLIEDLAGAQVRALVLDRDRVGRADHRSRPLDQRGDLGRRRRLVAARHLHRRLAVRGDRDLGQTGGRGLRLTARLGRRPGRRHPRRSR